MGITSSIENDLIFSNDQFEVFEGEKYPEDLIDWPFSNQISLSVGQCRNKFGLLLYFLFLLLDFQ